MKTKWTASIVMCLALLATAGEVASARELETSAQTEDQFRYSLLTARQRWVVNTVTAHVRKFEKENAQPMALTPANLKWMVKTLHVHPEEVWLVADQMQRLAAGLRSCPEL